MGRVSTEDRLKRILALVPWVVAHDGPTVEETCTRFMCTPTDLASDIELLYLCGLYPYTPDLLIEAAIADGRVFIQYADYFSRPLRLTPAEALAVVAAASTLLATPGTETDGPLARGLAKLSAITGSSSDAVDVELGAVEPELLGAIRGAAQHGTQLDIDYYAFGRDERTQRTIEPDAVFSTGGQWYVRAFCHTAKDQRTFRVDRILDVRETDKPRTGPRRQTPAKLFETALDEEVTLDLAPAARWVVDQYPIKSAVETDDGTTRVVLPIAEYAWLDRLVLRLGSHATVITAPANWSGRARAAQRVLALYSE